MLSVRLSGFVSVNSVTVNECKVCISQAVCGGFVEFSVRYVLFKLSGFV